MSKLKVWQVGKNGPVSIPFGAIDLEKHLEDWIEQDSNLLQIGLEIIGRQCYLPGNRLRLDLLAINPQGEFVVIELKPGLLYSEVITQALEYAAILAEMPYSQIEQLADRYLAGKGKTLRSIFQSRSIDPADQADGREVRIVVAGVNKDPGLERLAGFLSGRYQLPISIVSFSVYRLESGELILARKDDEFPQYERTSRPKITIESVCQGADQNGIGLEFRAILETMQSLGLYPRSFPASIMYAPPDRKNRALVTVWNSPNREVKIKMYVGARVFPEFFPVSEGTALRILGEQDWQAYAPGEISTFLDKISALFAEIQGG